MMYIVYQYLCSKQKLSQKNQNLLLRTTRHSCNHKKYCHTCPVVKDSENSKKQCQVGCVLRIRGPLSHSAKTCRQFHASHNPRPASHLASSLHWSRFLRFLSFLKTKKKQRSLAVHQLLNLKKHLCAILALIRAN